MYLESATKNMRTSIHRNIDTCINRSIIINISNSMYIGISIYMASIMNTVFNIRRNISSHTSFSITTSISIRKEY